MTGRRARSSAICSGVPPALAGPSAMKGCSRKARPSAAACKRVCLPGPKGASNGSSLDTSQEERRRKCTRELRQMGRETHPLTAGGLSGRSRAGREGRLFKESDYPLGRH